MATPKRLKTIPTVRTQPQPEQPFSLEDEELRLFSEYAIYFQFQSYSQYYNSYFDNVK